MNIAKLREATVTLHIKSPNIIIRGLIWLVSFVDKELATQILMRNTLYRLGKDKVWRPLDG